MSYQRVCEILNRGQLNDVPLAHAGKLVQYIKDPGSLEASLAQLTRDMKSASDEASWRMKEVQDLYHDIPQVTQEIENIFNIGRTTGQRDLDSLIRLMDDNHKECLKHTTSCTARLENVGKLIEEILELCKIREGSFEDKIIELESKKYSLNAKVSSKQSETDYLCKRIIERKELNEARENLGRTKSEKVDTVVKEVALTTFIGGASVAATIGAVVFPPLIPLAIASAAITGVHSVKSGVNIAEASDAHKSAKIDLDYEEWKHERCRNELAELICEISQLQSALNQVLKSNESLSSQMYTLGQCRSQVAQLKQNWGNMERFFQRVADRVSETDGIRINQFTNTARALSGKGTSALKTRILRSQAELVRQSTGTRFEAMGRMLEAFSFNESFNERGSMLGYGQDTRRSSSVHIEGDLGPNGRRSTQHPLLWFPTDYPGVHSQCWFVDLHKSAKQPQITPLLLQKPNCRPNLLFH